MKAKNKTEREVECLSAKLPKLSKAQIEWAIKHCSEESVAYSRKDRNSIGSFYIVTTSHGWQVLRYFQLFVKYRYHKRTDRVHYCECMQHWLKDGKYVFMSRQRMMGWYIDKFCHNLPMEVRTKTRWGFLGDPRNCGYDDYYLCKVQNKYKYVLRDFGDKIPIDELFRAINASTFSETLIRQHSDLWDLCRYRGVIYDKEKLAAVKVAIRHKYKVNAEWFDMLDNLSYLRKDLRNPQIICPTDLKVAHDKWLEKVQHKKKAMSKKMSDIRKIAEEKAQLRYLQAQEQREKERKKEIVGLSKLYLKRRKKYFGLVIGDDLLNIQVLKSVDDFFEEGQAMHHCVFSNGYYDVNRKPNCLILSAKANGERVETIEVDLSTGVIIQSRGKYNQSTPYHERIINLVKRQMDKILAL